LFAVISSCVVSRAGRILFTTGGSGFDMYQVIAYVRDRADTCTHVINHRRMGVKSFDVAVKWLKQHQYAELRKSTERGFEAVAVINKGHITYLR